jgi:hypothetical protein
MMSPMEIIVHLCKRPKVWNAGIESPRDLLAAIRGICIGVGDPSGEICLGDFPAFVQSFFPEHGKESWYITLLRLTATKPLAVACDTVLNLIGEWEKSDRTLPPTILLGTNSDDRVIDRKTFHLMEDALRNPLSFLPGVSTLQEFLVFLWGIGVSRWPPHGNIPGLVDFSAYVRQHFSESKVWGVDAILFTELRDYPFREACLVAADLIKDWRASVLSPSD